MWSYYMIGPNGGGSGGGGGGMVDSSGVFPRIGNYGAYYP